MPMADDIMSKLDELERLEKGATPGPWQDAHGELAYDWDNDGYIRLASSPCISSPPGSRRYKAWAADRAFIAALRNAAPNLIAAARRAEHAERFCYRAAKDAGSETFLCSETVPLRAEIASLRALLSQAEEALTAKLNAADDEADMAANRLVRSALSALSDKQTANTPEAKEG